MDIAPEQRFHFHDGQSAGSLQELMQTLARISYVEFYRHVNPDKNDFANWVRHVLNEPHLATELERVSSIVETIEIINDHLHPRPITQPRTDTQSAIEHDVFGDQYPGLEVPTTEPAMASPSTTHEVADFTIIEESTNAGATRADFAVPEMPQKAKPIDEHGDTGRMIVRDFIFGFLLGVIIGALLGRMLP